MLPVNKANNLAIVIDEDIIGMKVWVPQDGLMEPVFFGNQLWGNLDELLQGLQMLGWVRLSVAQRLAICPLEW